MHRVIDEVETLRGACSQQRRAQRQVQSLFITMAKAVVDLLMNLSRMEYRSKMQWFTFCSFFLSRLPRR